LAYINSGCCNATLETVHILPTHLVLNKETEPKLQVWIEDKCHEIVSILEYMTLEIHQTHYIGDQLFIISINCHSS
jgi:hypothetical protein